MKKILLFIAIIFSTHTQALEFQGKFLQGHFILGKAKIGSKVFIDKKQVKVYKDGYFVFGIALQTSTSSMKNVLRFR